MLNVMVDENGDAKIIDFGLAFMRSVDDLSELREKFPGTAAFAAPEVLMHEDYDAEVDVWAMGIILYLMGTGDVRRLFCLLGDLCSQKCSILL